MFYRDCSEKVIKKISWIIITSKQPFYLHPAMKKGCSKGQFSWEQTSKKKIKEDSLAEDLLAGKMKCVNISSLGEIIM